LRALVNNAYAPLAAAIAAAGPGAASGLIADAMTHPDRLADTLLVNLDSLQVGVTNRGLVTQITAGLKNVVYADLLRERRPFTTKDADAAFANSVAERQPGCHRGVAQLEPICQQLADVVLGKQHSLHVTARPSSPVSLAQVMTQFGETKDVASVLELFNLSVK